MDRCSICGEDNANVLQRKRIVPPRYGGKDTEENVELLCANCGQALQRLYSSRFYDRLGVEAGDESNAPADRDEFPSVDEFEALSIREQAAVLVDRTSHGEVSSLLTAAYKNTTGVDPVFEDEWRAEEDIGTVDTSENSGEEKSQREKWDELKQAKELVSDVAESYYNEMAPVDEVSTRFQSELDCEGPDDAEGMIEKLRRKGEVYEPKKGRLRTT